MKLEGWDAAPAGWNRPGFSMTIASDGTVGVWWQRTGIIYMFAGLEDALAWVNDRVAQKPDQTHWLPDQDGFKEPFRPPN